MINRFILAFISFIAGCCVAVMLYDATLANSGYYVATHAIEVGIPLDITWAMKLAWTIVMISVAIAFVLFPPKERSKKEVSI